MAEKATPRPWKLVEYNNECGWAIYAEPDGCIAERWYDNPDLMDSGARARVPAIGRLIVQAVNSHDALVEALGAASDELEHVIRAHGLNLDPDVLEQIYAALALAKQEAK